MKWDPKGNYEKGPQKETMRPNLNCMGPQRGNYEMGTQRGHYEMGQFEMGPLEETMNPTKPYGTQKRTL